VTVQNGTIRGGLSTCVEGAVVDGDSNQFISMKAFDADANFDLDMADANVNCDSNDWFDNVFSTANQSCIH
jgi:hypothetical protein